MWFTCGVSCGLLLVLPLVLEFEVSLFPVLVLLLEFPEMLPALLGELVPLLAVAPAAPPFADALLDPLPLTCRLSFTPCTPATDFAMLFARFLSSLLATVPSSVTLPFSTETLTPLSAWSELYCCCTCCCRVVSSTVAFWL
jgi:hypothetical protein